MNILLDISRTVARARLPRATGIDRVERAYIRWAATLPDAAYLARVDGLLYLLPGDAVGRLVSWLDGDAAAPRYDLRGLLHLQREPALRRAQSLIRRSAASRCHPRQVADMLRGAGCVGAYLNVGHDNLDPVTFRQIGQAGLRRITLLHDTIPLDHPEFARAGTPGRFRERFQTALSGEGLIANSAYTANRISDHGGDGAPPVHVLHLGLDPVEDAAPDPQADHPAFVVLGTIEPRKNIAMLLEVWQRLTHGMGETAPHLHIIGRRGWDIRNVTQILNTDPMIGRTVFEHGPLDDTATRSLLAGCRALLFPSHVEGFGLPLAEALQSGVLVLASDIPALREIGGDVPEWLPADNADRWHDTVLSYSASDSAARAAQISRMDTWKPPTWDAHFRALENLMETILVQPVRRG